MERETIVLRCGKFDGNGGFECPNCGNHVCGNCAETNFGLCPHCLSRLYRITGYFCQWGKKWRPPQNCGRRFIFTTVSKIFFLQIFQPFSPHSGVLRISLCPVVVGAQRYEHNEGGLVFGYLRNGEK